MEAATYHITTTMLEARQTHCSLPEGATAASGAVEAAADGQQGAACTLPDGRARPGAQVKVAALDVGHFDVYMGPAFDRTMADQLAFLQARARALAAPALRPALPA
jgi:hypothetical protein